MPNWQKVELSMNRARVCTHDGTRTHNLTLRRGTPYPLGHAGNVENRKVDSWYQRDCSTVATSRRYIYENKNRHGSSILVQNHDVRAPDECYCPRGACQERGQFLWAMWAGAGGARPTSGGTKRGVIKHSFSQHSLAGVVAAATGVADGGKDAQAQHGRCAAQARSP